MDFPNKPLTKFTEPIEQPTLSVNFESATPLPPPARQRPETISPDNPSWNSLTAFGVWFLSIILLFALQLLTIAIYTVIKAVEKNLVTQEEITNELSQLAKNDPNIILWSIISIIPAHLLTILVVWAVVTKFGKQPFFKTLGWKWWKNADVGFSTGTMALVACFLLSVGLLVIGGAVTSYFGEQETELLRILRSSRTVVYVTAFLATFTAPFVEEIVYRGVLYSAFQKWLGKFGGVILVTLLFAAVHVPQYLGSLPVILIICLLSLILTMIRAWTGNILACVVIHTIFNGIQSLTMVLFPEALQPKEPSEAFLRLFGL